MSHNKINKIKKNIKNNFDVLYQDSLKAFKNNEVPVSALIYDPQKKKIISKAYNTNNKDNNPCSHAEISVIIKSCKKLKKKRLDGYDLYSTLEPCLMCSSVIFASKIRRVYFAIEDKKIGAMVNNYKLALSKHMNHKIDAYYGFCEEKFSKLISNFFKKKR